MLIFLDTEFTNFPESECDLISIGLVDEDGRDFYAELIDYRDEACSGFVKEIVLPLLKTYPNRLEGTRWTVAHALNKWLQPYKDSCIICFDYHTDWNLMYDMLLLLPDEDLPDFVTAKNIWGGIDKLAFDNYFLETQLPQHMALYDAYANRTATTPAFKHMIRGQHGSN
jgi:hypothetical protein